MMYNINPKLVRYILDKLRDSSPYKESSITETQQQELIERISDPIYQDKMNIEYNRIDIDNAWNYVDKKTSKFYIWNTFMKCAVSIAVFFVCSFTAYIIFKDINNVDHKTVIIGCNDAVRKSGAILQLGNGAVVNLSGKDEHFVDGGVDINNKNNLIFYNKNHLTAVDSVMYNTMITPKGMTYQLVLSDGTKVFLNSQTKLRFPTEFKDDIRMVELDGEAFFVVVSDSSRPFKVSTALGLITAVGTEFNVKCYHDNQYVSAYLSKGIITANDVKLIPQHKAIWKKMNASPQIVCSSDRTELAWMNDEFIFQDIPLSEVMDELARWYDVNYVFVDECVKQVKIGAKFKRRDSILPILEILGELEGVSITYSESGIVFSKP